MEIDMARITTQNVQLSPAQRGLQGPTTISDTLQRLSSGLRSIAAPTIPPAFIAAKVCAAKSPDLARPSTTRRALNVISTAESNLGEIANLLTNVKQLVVEAANKRPTLSQDEIAANQLQIDSAWPASPASSNTATFAGLKLLNWQPSITSPRRDGIADHCAARSSSQFRHHRHHAGEIDVSPPPTTTDLQFQASSIASSVTLEISGQ